VTLPPFSEWSDPRLVAEMAREADEAGWDGFFLWDHVTWDPAWGGTPPMADPWLCLAAAAMVTSHVRLGPMVARAARYDGVVPGKVGQERGESLTVDDLMALRDAVGRDDDGYDYVVSGNTASPDDTGALRDWAGAGATWWLESLHPFAGRAGAMRDRLRAGPPRL
jgi:hypothetical protein